MNEDHASDELLEALPSDSAAMSKTIDIGTNPSAFGFEGADLSQSITPAGQRQIANRYEILGLLGSGGMGNVYRVRDITLDEQIALKTLRNDLADSEQALGRFRREVKLARRVTHPNVARTFDIGTDGGLTYLTMEYIEGEPLTLYAKRFSSGTLAQLVELMVQVARGLEAAHEAGVIHRDLKPANIMVASTGRAVITDFGIARASGHSTGSLVNTGASGLVGTPLYMAPEQVEGKEVIDFRADIYAFGCILYELLAGQPPFLADSPVAVAIARLMKPAPKLSPNDYPVQLTELVAKTLERDPADRHVTTGMLVADLETILENLETDAVGLPAVNISTTIDDMSSATRIIDHLQNTPQPQNKTTIAVLPIVNRQLGRSCYMCEGLSEELAGELSMSPTLLVKEASRINQEGESLREFGQKLGVDLLVTGSLRTMGEDQMRVRIALVSVEDGFQIWGEKFTGSQKDIFQIAEDAAEAIAEALRAKAGGQRPEALTDPVAIDLYMRARHSSQTRWYKGMDESIDLFRRALERAPDDPRILTGMATSLARQTFFKPIDTATLLTEATEHAMLAVDRAPDWPDPHFALAIVAYNRGDIIATEHYCRDALARHPEHLESLDLLGRVLAEMGPLEEAQKHLEHALSINEGLLRATSDLQRTYALQDKWEAYDALLARRAEIPDYLLLTVQATDYRLAVWRGNLGEVSLGDNDQLPNDLLNKMLPIANGIHDYLERGEEVPKALIEGLITMGKQSTPGSQQQLLGLQIGAEFASYAKHDELMYDALTTVIDMGLRDLMWLEHAPIFNHYREQPRFQRLRQRVALKYQARARIHA